VVTRAGKARAGRVAPKVPPRIANRSAADQAHRDKLAKQWKTVEKPARRAAAISKATFKAAAGLPPAYPRLSKARKIGGDSRYIRENIAEQTARLKRSPSRGKNKLTPQQRGQIVSDAVASARSLRARAAMTTPRRATLRARGARMGGTIAKPKGLKPGTLKAKAKAKPATPRGPATSRLRPGELMNAVARPVGTMARPRRGENLFVNAKSVPLGERRKATLQNIKRAKAWLESRGVKVVVYGGGKGTYGRAERGSGTVQLNRNSPGWQDPVGNKISERRSGFKSTSSPVHTLWHEMGHARDTVGNIRTAMVRTRKETWLTPNLTLDPWTRRVRGQQVAQLARRVSRYATTNPSEFIAETYAGLRTGRRYDFQVMRAYREAMGLSPTPAARRRSRVRRPKP
jgi:hypothetical protein